MGGGNRSLGEIMTCSKCGTDNQGAAFCSSCGTALAVMANPYVQQPMRPSASNNLSTIAIILAAIGLLFVPIVFGTAGLILGIVAKSKQEPRANVAIAIGIIGLVGGIILGAIIGAATFGY